MANPRYCAQCGTELTPNARFCAHCGASLTTDAVHAAVGSARGQPAAWLGALVPWIVTFVAVFAIATIAFSSRAPGAGGAASPVEPGIVLAPDISTLSPEERVDRLFNRVMSLSSAGKEDSVAFFAPMAVNAIAALVPLTSHRHYDLGLVLLVSGDIVGARAQADTILAASPAHLLGLALAMRTANAAGETAGARRFGTRFTAALNAERAKGLPEYADHAPDIADAIEEAAGRRVRMVGQPR